MYRELVQQLSKEQIDALQEMGVARSIVSNWKHGKRLPTRPQTIMLSTVCNVDAMTLERELMLMESAPEHRDLFKRLVGLAMSLFLVFGILTEPEHNDINQGLGTSPDAPAEYTSSKVT